MYRDKLLYMIVSVALLAALTACQQAAPETDVAAPSAAIDQPAQEVDEAAQEPVEEAAEAPDAAALAEAGAAPTTYVSPNAYVDATGETIASFSQSSILAEMVEAGQLPPVEERLPQTPAVIAPSEAIGQYGGELRLVSIFEEGGYFLQEMEDSQQTLFTMDIDYQTIKPNIVQGWELSDDARTLTLFLRPGMKWSDGDDFNADDFVFWYEDILQNPDLVIDVEPRYQPGGELMQLERIDDYTVRYTFTESFPTVIERWRTATIYAPEHFLKPYYPKYNEGAEGLAAEEGYDEWWQAVQAHSVAGEVPIYSSDPTAPTLNPWKISQIGAESVIWERNPYYWKIDPEGNQLPYIDRIVGFLYENPNDIAPLKLMSGEVDVGNIWLSLSDFPVFKRNEEQGNYTVYLFPEPQTSFAIGFALNYTHQDPVLREIFNDLRFRQALSLAIDRQDMSETLFSGLTEPYVAPVSPLWTGYEDWMGTYYAEHDVERANQLLDEMGLAWDANLQWRLRPDGEPLDILGEWTIDYLDYADEAMELVADDWAEIGVRMEPKFVPGETLLPRYQTNEQDIGVWSSDGGSEITARGAYPIRLIPPWHWASCCAISAYPWRQWLDTNGEQGEEPPEEIKALWAKTQEWLTLPRDDPRYEELANEIITQNVEQLYFFGAVSAPPRPVIFNNRLGNVPREGSFLDGMMLGPYRPETWYIKE